MKRPYGKHTLVLVLVLLLCLSLGTAVVASADEPVPVQGPTVTADPNSPTGYTVTFVYYNPNATQVRLAGDLLLRDVANGTTVIRYQPELWQLGRYHVGGAEFLRDMTNDGNGYWSVSIPMHAGGLSYWYRVWDPTQSPAWVNKRIWDPTSSHPRPAVDPNNVANSTSYRVKNNDVLDAVYVPIDVQKQNDPTLLGRAIYELPIADPAQRGTVQYIPYTTILGGVGYNLGVYLPAGYDANRAEPYKVLYLAHGAFGDETDWLVPGNAPIILDNMIARGELEPTVLVTMGNHFTPAANPANLPTYNQQNAANNLVQVILPLIEANYNVSNVRAGRAYAGFSQGGFTGGNVLNTYPTTFGFYGFFSGNGTFSTAQYNSIANVSDATNLFVFLGNGVFEGNLNAQNTIANNFRTRGIPAETAQVRGAHDMMTAGMLFTIFAREYLWTGYPPVWAPIGDKSVDENRALTFTAAASDPEGKDLTYSTSPLPAGASFDAATQEFSWTPDYTQAGVYPIIFYASDGKHVVGSAINITVNDVLVTDQIAGLKSAVADTSLNNGLKNALTVKLNQALKLLEKGKSSEAAQLLQNDFIGQVVSLRNAGKLTEAQAAELITGAEEAILNITQNS